MLPLDCIEIASIRLMKIGLQTTREFLSFPVLIGPTIPLIRSFRQYSKAFLTLASPSRLDLPTLVAFL